MRRLIITLLILIGVLVAADFAAAAVAESAVSRQMREQIGLVDDPSVRINGFPFLIQAISGHYHSVDISAQRISVGEFRDLEVRAQLRDVTAPLGELLGSGGRPLQVHDAEGAVRVSPKDIERLLPGVDKLRIDSIDTEALERAVATGGEAALAEIDPDTAARLVGTTEVLDQQLEVSVIAVLQLADGRAQIVPRHIRLGDAGAPPLPSFAQRALRELFTLRVDPGSLPLAVTPTTLRAKDGTLEISGVATDLVLGGAASTGG